MKEVYIIDAARTAIGNFGGSLSTISPAQMGATVLKELFKRNGMNGEEVDEVLMGSVLQAGHGQNVARQIAMEAGIPKEKTAMTINMVCGSGLRTVAMAAQSILAGDAELIIAGGAENMSQAPYILPKARNGYRMGDGTLVDTMVADGLTDVFNNFHMGITAENLADKYNLTREEQDEFSALSQNKAEKAINENRFADEIVAIEIPQRRKDPIIFDTDEYPKATSTAEKLAKLRPAFKKEGSVTAGNASGINDGAAALVIMSKEKADELGITPLATISAHASAGCDPKIMGIGPVPATDKALTKAGLKIADMDLVEANEAFAAQSLAVAKELNLEMDKVNVNGGAIALGHPIGCSGARILVTLLHELKRRDAKHGLATLCIGGGMGEAVIVSR